MRSGDNAPVAIPSWFFRACVLGLGSILIAVSAYFMNSIIATEAASGAILNQIRLDIARIEARLTAVEYRLVRLEDRLDRIPSSPAKP